MALFTEWALSAMNTSPLLQNALLMDLLSLFRASLNSENPGWRAIRLGLVVQVWSLNDGWTDKSVHHLCINFQIGLSLDLNCVIVLGNDF